MRIQNISLVIIFTLFIHGCFSPNSNNAGETEGDYQNEVPSIIWDSNSLTKVYNGPAFYPRIIRLQDHTLMGVFESEGSTMVTTSNDEGNSWSEALEVKGRVNGINAAVPEAIQLQNGNIIVAYNTRPPQDNNEPDRKFGIKIKISEDNGETWSEEKNIYEGGFTWNSGVWEPAMIQFPNGEINLFFANEYPYDDSEDQEISMVSSEDNGKTWSAPQTISYREGYRDGMPVPLILHDGKGIAVAIEDNGLYGNTFKPAIIWTSLEEGWSDVVRGRSQNRWSALVDEYEIEPNKYGGAPYLRQMPSGKTILSFQTNEGRSGDWTNSTMVVAVGDEQAKNFSLLTEPFDVPEGRSAMWSSVFIKNATTIIAVTSTNAYSRTGQSEFYIIDGHITAEN